VKYFKIVVLIILLIANDKIFACCAGDFIGIYPRNSSITRNSAFLLEFNERDFPINNKISEIEFVAINSKGKEYILTIIQNNFSGTMRQFFLKSNSKFRHGDTLYITTKYRTKNNVDINIEKFSRGISYKKWVVEYKEDTKKPFWLTDTINYTTNDHRNSSVHGYSVSFNLPLSDNSKTERKYERKNKYELPFYYEVISENQKFICSAENGSPLIYSSICGTNFNFTIGKKQNARFIGIDNSGNFSEEDKKFTFLPLSEKSLRINNGE